MLCLVASVYANDRLETALKFVLTHCLTQFRCQHTQKFTVTITEIRYNWKMECLLIIIITRKWPINNVLSLAMAIALLLIFSFILICFYCCRLSGVFLSFFYISLPINCWFWCCHSESWDDRSIPDLRETGYR